MDRVLSTRVDEAVILQISILARELNLSKKAVIESAIKLYSEKTGMEKQTDPLKNTCGAWNRSESPMETIKTSRSAFNRSMERHHR